MQKTFFCTILENILSNEKNLQTYFDPPVSTNSAKTKDCRSSEKQMEIKKIKHCTRFYLKFIKEFVPFYDKIACKCI